MSRRSIVKNSAAPLLARTLHVLTAGALGMAGLLSLVSAPGHDQLWFLLLARRWLGGATLYGPEAFDSNPPGIIWLSAIPARLGTWLPLPAHDSATTWATLLLVLLAGAIALLLRPLLRRAIPALQPPGEALLLLAFVVVAGILPARDFGQRDFLAGLLCIPYVLAAAAASSAGDPASPTPDAPHDRMLVALSTLLAATGLCLKPQQALLALATEASLLLFWWHDRRKAQQSAEKSGSAEAQDCSRAVNHSSGHTDLPAAVRSPRSELPTDRSRNPRNPTSHHPLRRVAPWALLVSGTAYCFAIRLFAPAYFSLALPLLRQTYWAISHLTTAELIHEAPQLHLLALAALALFVWQSRTSHPATAAPAYCPAPPTEAAAPDFHPTPRIPRTTGSPTRRTIAVFLAAGCGGLLAYHLQATGWYYQQLPALSFFTLALALQLLGPISRVRSVPRHLPVLAGALSVLAVALAAWFSRDALSAPHAIDLLSPDPALFAHATPGTPVAILTTSVEDSMMPVERFRLTWAQRTNNLWLLPAVLRSQDPSANPTPAHPHHLTPGQVAALDTLIHRWMVEDLTRWRPSLVLVARCPDPQVHCQELEDRHDDLLAWFARDPAFRAAWSRYKLVATSGSYDAYSSTRTNTIPR